MIKKYQYMGNSIISWVEERSPTLVCIIIPEIIDINRISALIFSYSNTEIPVYMLSTIITAQTIKMPENALDSDK